MVPLLIPLMNKLADLNISLNAIAMAYLVSASFILAEIGLRQFKGSGALDDPLRAFGAVVAVTGIILSVLMFMGIPNVGWLLALTGSLLAIYSIVEGLR